jgi:hypothetical protein
MDLLRFAPGTIAESKPKLEGLPERVVRTAVQRWHRRRWARQVSAVEPERGHRVIDLSGDLLERESGVVYSIPVRTQTAFATFRVFVDRRGGNNPPTLLVTIEHRDGSSETWSSAGVFTPITATGLSQKSIQSGLKTWARLKCEESGGSSDGFVSAHVLPPVWAP